MSPRALMAAAAALLLLPACTGGASPNPGPPPGADVSVCAVADGGAGALSQMVRDGLARARDRFGVEARILVGRGGRELSSNLRRCAAGHPHVVVAVTARSADAIREARASPRLRFVAIDPLHSPSEEAATPLPSNLMQVTFRLDQAAFLAGFLAAGMSRTGRVATFGAAGTPSITEVEEGFAGGALRFDVEHAERIDLLGWDPRTGEGTVVGPGASAGRRAAAHAVARGVDVIMPVGGQATAGAAALARAVGNVMIVGVGADRATADPELADVWLTTVEGRVDVAVLREVEALLEGRFRGGAIEAVGLPEGAVGLGPFHRFADRVPKGLRNELEELELGIADGTVSLDPAVYLQPTGPPPTG